LLRLGDGGDKGKTKAISKRVDEIQGTLRASNDGFLAVLPNGGSSDTLRLSFEDSVLSTTDTDDTTELPAPIKSVAATILGEYFATLENEEGFAEVAARLRKVVLEDDILAEPAIRMAIFPDTQ
jgi:hypothetical protein